VTAADGKVFVTDDAHLWYGVQMWTLNEADGTLLWGKTFDDMRHANPAAYVDGKVYMTTSNEFYISYYEKWYESFLQGFDAETGALVATSAAFGSNDDPMPAPTAFGANIYMGGTSQRNAFAADGAFAWQVSANGGARVQSPAVTDDYYITVDYYGLAVFDRVTGDFVHNLNGPYFGPGYQDAPVLGDYSNVLVAGYPGTISSYNWASPEVQWRRGEGGFFSNPSAAHGLLYVLHDGLLEARSQFDGSLLWSWASPLDSVTGKIAVTSNYVFVADSANTYAINIDTHDMDWSWPRGGDLTITRSGTLLIAGDDGVLTALDLTGDSDGDQLPDSWEILHGLNPADPDDADTDIDGDMLTSREEFYLGTDPTARDTDRDWLPDGYEWEAGLDPLDSTDSWQDPDSDGTVTFYEYVIGTDPLVAESRAEIWRRMWEYMQTYLNY